MRALPTQAPQHIAEVLLNERNLGLHGKYDVLQARFRSVIRGHAGQDPCAAFLVHQSSRAVNRINDDAPEGLCFTRAARQNDLPACNPFCDQNMGRSGRHLMFEELKQEFLTHAIDRVNRVAGAAVIVHPREVFQVCPFAGGHYFVAHAFVQTAQRRE